jgi:hypothetical protein
MIDDRLDHMRSNAKSLVHKRYHSSAKIMKRPVRHRAETIGLPKASDVLV